MVTPRYFADVALDNVAWPCSLYSVCNGSLLLVTVRTFLCFLICESGNITNLLCTDLFRSNSGQHYHGPNLLWVEMSTFPAA